MKKSLNFLCLIGIFTDKIDCVRVKEVDFDPYLNDTLMADDGTDLSKSNLERPSIETDEEIENAFNTCLIELGSHIFNFETLSL